MLKLRISMGLRRAPFSPVSIAAIVQAALDICEWADECGFYDISIGEHHGTEDEYIPSPLLLMSAIAARTRYIKLAPVVLAPLYDPIRLAEDLAVVDVISSGRLEPIIAAGYVPIEFAMFGKSLGDRAMAMDNILDVLKKAWTGEPFLYQDATIRVTPRPHQCPRPPITVGGMSKAAARRAARSADRFEAAEPGHWLHYEEECRRLGRDTGPSNLGISGGGGPAFLHVTENPEAAWEFLAPYLLHNIAQYSRWTSETFGRPAGPFGEAGDMATLKRNPAFKIITPDECISLARSYDTDCTLNFSPLMSGIPPEVAWASLKLFETKVLPHLTIIRPNR